MNTTVLSKLSRQGAGHRAKHQADCKGRLTQAGAPPVPLVGRALPSNRWQNYEPRGEQKQNTLRRSYQTQKNNTFSTLITLTV